MTIISLEGNPFETQQQRQTIDPETRVGFGSWLTSQTHRMDNVGWLARRVADDVRRGRPLPRNADELTRQTPICGSFDPIRQARHSYYQWLAWVLLQEVGES